MLWKRDQTRTDQIGRGDRNDITSRGDLRIQPMLRCNGKLSWIRDPSLTGFAADCRRLMFQARDTLLDLPAAGLQQLGLRRYNARYKSWRLRNRAGFAKPC